MPQTLIECPKCSKKTVVERGNSFYQCLACDFQRDLAKPESKPDEFPWVLVLFIVVLLLFIGRKPTYQPSYSPQVAPQTYPGFAQ
jgi:hypothetical protein